jgi:4-amino-4-deoxy-L-arabinose transferase-like glycosyltransferase
MHYWDENVYLLNAEYFGFGKAGYMEIASRPPLLSLLFAGIFKVWHSDYAAEIVAAALNALAPTFLYLAGRKTLGKTAAAIAALLLAFGPYFVGVIPDEGVGFLPYCDTTKLLSDCPALTLIVLSLWLMVRALEVETDIRFACAGFCFACAVLMRFGSLASVGVLALLVMAAGKPLRAATTCAVGFIAGMAPYLFWSRMHYGGFFATIRNGWSNLNGPTEPFLYYARHLPQLISWTAIAGLAICAGRGILSILRREGQNQSENDPDAGFERDRKRWVGFLWLWAFVILAFFSSLSHKELRYAIPLVPPLLLLAGVGLSALVESPKALMRRAGAFALVVAMLAAVWPSHHRFDTGFFDHTESDEMVAAEFLRQNVPASTQLYANLNYPDFAWYTGMTTSALPEGGEALSQALNKLPNEVILIAYKQNDSDGSPAEPLISSLDANPRFTRLKEFDNIVLYKCRSF